MKDRVGRYIIKGQVGKGAMGVVYLADDPLLNRQAAIKTLDLSIDDAQEAAFLRGRLLRDAQAAAGLTHPNIVSVYDVVEEGEAVYLVLEFVPGDTLSARLSATPIPEAAFTISVLRGMASALDYTHARGIIHRDIKPANVMIEPNGAPKIMDFGIARIADSRTNTPTGMVMGTVDYMSPEQIKGETVDGRSDQFALAAVAARMLTGQTLYGQHSLPTLAYKIVNEAAPPMRARNAALPASVDTVLGKALAKNPADRFATCGQFVQDLATALAMNVVEPPTRTLAMPAAAPAPLYQAATASAPVPAYATSPGTSGVTPSSSMQAVLPPQKKSPVAAIVAGVALLAAGGGLAMWAPWKAAPEKQASTAAAPASTPANQTAPAPSPAATPSAPVETKPVETAPAVAANKVKEAPPKSASAAPGKDITPARTVIEESAPPMDAPIEEEAAPSDAPKPAVEAYNRGRQLALNHKFPEAIAAFTQALTIRGGYPMARFQRGRAYQQLNDCNSALQDFDTMLKARPKFVPAYAYRGLCEVKMKHDDAGLADFEQALAFNPKFGMALYGRGLVRNHRGGYKKALDDLNQAVAQMPAYPNAYQARAIARRNLGDAAGASADDAKAQDLIGAGKGQRRPE